MLHRLAALLVAVVAFTATATFAAPQSQAPASPYQPPHWPNAPHISSRGTPTSTASTCAPTYPCRSSADR